ncbi:MAG TPA: Ig-like domain repeat protein [Streptosporangiaceae bacterium]|nr:Ig-like domain repeat protein [Streptosporangiaceae bacterium]
MSHQERRARRRYVFIGLAASLVTLTTSLAGLASPSASAATAAGQAIAQRPANGSNGLAGRGVSRLSAAVSAGAAHAGKRAAPRKVRLPKQLHPGVLPNVPMQAKVHGRQDADGQPPPGFGGGKATRRLPRVVSDNRPRGRSGAPAPRTETGNFATLESLTGATFANTCTVSGNSCNGAEPPDTQMAAGTTEIVNDVNNNIFVFDRGGNLLNSYALTAVFQPPNQSVGLTDPKILFDPTTGDFYATEMVCQNAGCGANNWTHMGISLAISSDPATGWTVYDYLNDGQDLQDQEKLGFSGDKITLAVNEYGCKCGSGTQFKQENIIVVQKSDAVAGNTITPAIYNDSSGSTYAFDSMPTTPVNASTSDNTQYVVWDGQQSSNNSMKVIRITGTPNANNVNFTGNVTTISMANQTSPPTPVAQGGNLAGDKQNFQSAMVQGNDLWAVATDGCTPQFPNPDTATRDCTRLVEVDLGSNSISTDTDLGTDGTYRINPSVSKDNAGHVFFGFTISSSTSFATAAIDGSGIPLPSVLQRVDLAAGDIAYGGGRWGDYSGTQQDPANNNDVWTAQEFGGCSAGCNPNFNNGPLWATRLGQFTFHDPQITSISPTQGPVTGGTTVDIFGSEFANGGTTVNFGNTASPNVTWINSTHIQAVSPAESEGTVDVTATTAAGTSNTSPSDQFTYRKIPTTTTYNGPVSGDYNDPVTLSATLTSQLTSQGVAGESISFTLGAESCSGTTDANGFASCTVTPADLPGNGYSVQAAFGGDGVYDPSGASTPFTVNQEESHLSYNGPVVTHYHDAFTASATLTDPDGGAPIPGKQVTFALGTGESCATTTDGSGSASCSITPTHAGPTTVSVSFSGDSFYLPSSDSKPFTIAPEETTTTYTGPTVILAGAFGTTLTATLLEDGANDSDGDPGAAAPNPPETVTLSVGSQHCTGLTDALGNVTCTIPSVTVGLGPETVSATFGGDAFYQGSSASTTATVFAFPSRGVFTLGDLTVAAAGPATTVNWWNKNWDLLNKLSGGSAPAAFKGFVGTTTLPTQTPANICSANWTTSSGASPPPPPTVPSYMGVIVSSKITKSGATINGKYAGIVVVKTDPGYAPSPQNAGTGKIVATFCSSAKQMTEQVGGSAGHMWLGQRLAG